jgi:hypothetical protein
MARIADRDAAQSLNALGDRIDQFVLLAGMFVEQKMQLIESRAAHQPVVLLVESVENLRIG